MLGGSVFVGRAVVTVAIDRGWSVTTFNRGRTPWTHPQTRQLVGDRLRPADLEQLHRGRWDAVVDTWAGAPRAVRDSAELLADRTDRYLYVSSRAVYTSPTPAGLDETHPTVPALPNAADIGYPSNKRGAELAVQAAFGNRAVLSGPGRGFTRLAHSVGASGRASAGRGQHPVSGLVGVDPIRGG